MSRRLALVAALALHGAAHAASPTIDALRWHRRIVLIAAPADNADAARQRATIVHWGSRADARDITVVDLAGARVTGAADGARALRQRFSLNLRVFQVLLIGKDGQAVWLRANFIPVTARRLQQIIDAMPMRRAGGR